MDLMDRFWVAHDELESTALGVVELLPSRLATAAVHVLPGVGAAGLSLFADDLRVPIGTSDISAALAQRVQFDVGDGPCFAAHRERSSVVADAATLCDRWLPFADALFAATAYRGVIALPLAFGLADVATMDFYLGADQDPAGIPLEDVESIAREITLVLIADRTGWSDESWSAGPPWVHNPSSAGRLTVSIASGMIITSTGQDFTGALGLLRRQAAARKTTVDLLAQAVVERAVSISELTGVGAQPGNVPNNPSAESF